MSLTRATIAVVIAVAAGHAETALAEDIAVIPSEISLHHKDAIHTLVVERRAGDDWRGDVTSEAVFESSNPAVAAVDADGVVRAIGNGEAAIGPITVSKVQPDLVVNTDATQLALVPGKASTLSVKLGRNNGFTSRVPIEVLNLPFGVYVMNTGLNRILVREGEYERTMEIYAEPWVTGIDRTIYVQARIETQSPIKPVFLGEPVRLKLADRVAQNDPIPATAD